MQTPYEAGTVVQLRGERWAVTRATRTGAYTVLTLNGRSPANANRRLRVIEPFDRPRRIASARLRRRPRRAVLRSALHAIASVRPAEGLWTAAAARIDLWPYQMEPALAVIGGASRVLLADAVGLGKTIQAGLILAELRERGWVEHALIVCPAGLRATWALELRERFGIAATILDQLAIATRIASLPAGVSPWDGHAVAIVSIDFIKRPEVAAAVDELPIDLLIADEAHHLAPVTDRGAAVSRLAARIPWCVLVSATPHSGDAAAFTYLCDIGSAADRIAVFRRGRRDVGIQQSRRSHLLPVYPDAAESALLEGISRYARAIWRARGQEDGSARLLAITLARRAASSAAAVERSLARRLTLLTSERIEPQQPSLPWDEYDEADDLEPDSILASPGLIDLQEEKETLVRLVDLARLAADGSKMKRLDRLLSCADEPALIFTEYRDTLDALVSRLSSSRRVGFIHGGLPADVRRVAVDRFNNGGIDVLIATDAAGEGLNLHHRCRLVIDIELPWSPLRLEQRAGRVDRLGQRRTVHAIRMFHPGGIEQDVLEHLRLRSRSAEEALAHFASASELARAIFESGRMPTTAMPIIASDTVPTAIEAARCEGQRRVLPHGAWSASGGWSMTRRASPLAVLHRCTLTNSAGIIVGERAAAHRVTLAVTPRHKGEWSSVIGNADKAVRADCAEAGAAVQARPMFERRIAILRERVAKRIPRERQRSLFDGRVDAEAAARAAVTARLDASLARVLAAVASPIDPAATRIEMVAAWSECGR